jgi:glycosyltransferase involved in cell wall biosynthesis
MESVRKQDYPGRVAHLIVIDTCVSTLRYLEQDADTRSVAWIFRSRRPGAERVPGRLGRLRNEAIRLAESHWVAFLDDDNEFYPNHLRTLKDAADRQHCSAVHSHRELLWRDGSAYLEPLFPWSSSRHKAARMYDKLRRAMVFEKGSNVMKDRIDSPEHPDGIRSADTSEWLVSKETAMRCPFPEDCSSSDWAIMKTEDDYFMERLVLAGIPIACSGLATLKYYVGGYSNRWLQRKFSGINAAQSGMAADR